MTWAAFAFLMTGVLLNAGAQLLLKAGTNVLGVITLTRDNWPDTLLRMATQGYFVAGVMLATCVSLIVWILGLSRVPVSIAYPMLSLGYVINAVAAHYLFGEAVTRDPLARHRLHRARRMAGGAELTIGDPHRRCLLKFASPLIDEATIAGVADVLRSGLDHERAVGGGRSRRRCRRSAAAGRCACVTSATAARRGRAAARAASDRATR